MDKLNLQDWFRSASWLHAVLSFVVLFFLGAVGALFWTSYNTELPKQSLAGQDQDALDQKIASEIEQSVLQTGAITGTFGLATYLLVRVMRKKKAT